MGAGVNVLDASADRSLSGIQALDGSGVDRTIVEGRVIGPDGDRIFWDPSGTSSFSVSTDTDLVSGVQFGSGIATTTAATATATGGTAPYSYAWTCVSHSATTAPTATSPSTASSAFTQTNMLSGRSYSATFTVTATDSATPPNHATYDVSAFWSDAS